MGLLKQILIDRFGKRKDDFSWRRFQAHRRISNGDHLCFEHLNDKLGDAVLNSMLADGLTRALQVVEITVLTTSSFESYWRSHPGVAHVLAIRDSGSRSGYRRILAESKRIAPYRGRFDYMVYFHPYTRLEDFVLLSQLGAEINIGFNKEAYRLFEISLQDPTLASPKRHFSERVKSVLNCLGISEEIENLHPHVQYSQNSLATVASRCGLDLTSRCTALVNPYGAGSDRQLSWGNTLRIAQTLLEGDFIDQVVVNLPSEGTLEGFDNSDLERFGGKLTLAEPQSSFEDLFALVDLAQLVVSVDTATGHVAAALGKPVFTLFHEPCSCPVVWKPLATKGDFAVAKQERNVNGMNWDECLDRLTRFARSASYLNSASNLNPWTEKDAAFDVS